MRGYGDPAAQLTEVYHGLAAAVERRYPDSVRAEITDGLSRLAREDVHEIVRMLGPDAAFYETWLRNRSVAIGAVAGAGLIVKLAAEPALPEKLSTQLFGLPKDPVSSQAFRYRKVGETFRFYGVGPDGKDDEGSESNDVLLLGPGA